MNILISRILLYMNSHALDNDFSKIGAYIIEHYLQFEEITIKRLLEEVGCSRTTLQHFLTYFNYCEWANFKNELIANREKRQRQQELRFINLDSNQYYDTLKYLVHDESFNVVEMREMVQLLVEDLHSSKRIHIFGAIYPLSLAVEFQTHMVSIGKPVIQWQNYNCFTHINLDKEDFAFIFSASGRYITECKQMFGDVYLSLAKKALVSQSHEYNHLDRIEYFMGFAETPDVFSYNHILICVLEIIYIEYCLKYSYYCNQE